MTPPRRRPDTPGDAPCSAYSQLGKIAARVRVQEGMEADHRLMLHARGSVEIVETCRTAPMTLDGGTAVRSTNSSAFSSTGICATGR